MNFDIVVIGAGVVGSAIARDLSRLQASVCLLEANDDFGDEASKGNSAIMCTGWDTSRDTLERSLVMRGYQRYTQECKTMGLPIKKVGETMVAWNENDIPVLEQKLQEAQQDGFNVHWLSKEALYKQHPNLGEGGFAGLHIPDECIVDPFSTVYGYVLDAQQNGTTYLPSSPVTAAQQNQQGWEITAGGKKIIAKMVINAAGLAGDKIDALAKCYDFTIKPRKGQFIVFDKLASSYVESVIVPTPTAAGRGVLVIPTIFGNVMVGPTAEEIEDADDRSNSSQSIDFLNDGYQKIVPIMKNYPKVTTFSGMRPATEHSDFQIKEHKEKNWITVGGIRSTGLSASLGIAEYICNMFTDNYAYKDALIINSITVPDLSATKISPWLTSGDPDDREVICHCEQITLGEIKRSLNSPVPPKSLKALKRRTRAGYGRCQSFFCGARVQQLFDQAQKEDKNV